MSSLQSCRFKNRSSSRAHPHRHQSRLRHPVTSQQPALSTFFPLTSDVVFSPPSDTPPALPTFSERGSFQSTHVRASAPTADTTSATRTLGWGALELFCGSARLSAALHRRGFEVLSVDKARNPHSQQGPWLSLNLLTEPAQRQIVQLVTETPALQFVWAAPPAATFTNLQQHSGSPLCVRLQTLSVP